MRTAFPWFRTFLKLRGLGIPPEARGLWSKIASGDYRSDEVAAIENVEDIRRRLLADHRKLERTDFGAGSRTMSQPSEHVEIGVFVRNTAVSPPWGCFLFSLARTVQARRMLELGTGAGLSAAYLRAALHLNGGERLVTIEGDPRLCTLARETLASPGSGSCLVVEGQFADSLPLVLKADAPFDFVFIDGHHDAPAVLRYIDMIVPHLSRDATLVLDDIQPITGAVRPAWNELLKKIPHAWSVYLLRMGVFRLAQTQ